MKNILLLGAGAVGMLPAVKLLKLPGINFYGIADRERVERYRREGISVNGEKVALEFLVPEEIFSADLIIVATKTTSLQKALENVSGMVSEKTVFLPLLNGITAGEVISARFPQANVLSGFFLGHASVREGNRITHDGIGTFYCGGDAEFLDPVMELFQSAGIDAEVPENMRLAMWQKFVLNVGINQTQAFHRADYGTVQKDPALLRFAWDLMEEAVAVGRAAGVPLGDEVIESAMMVICRMPGGVKTSMLQDVEAGRITEVDAFAGTICALGNEYNIEVPKNKLVLEKIKEFEK